MKSNNHAKRSQVAPIATSSQDSNSAANLLSSSRNRENGQQQYSLMTTQGNENLQTEQNLLGPKEKANRTGTRRKSIIANGLGGASNILRVSKFSDEPIQIQFDQRNSLAPNFQQPQNSNPLTRSMDHPTTLGGGGDTNMNLRTATDRSFIGEGLKNPRNEESLLGAELNPKYNKQGTGLAKTQRVVSRYDEIMEIFKSGVYHNEHGIEGRLRPHSSKAVQRESRKLKRLLSMTKEDEDRDNIMLKHTIRQVHRSPVFQMSSNAMLPQKKMSSTKAVVQFRNGIFEIKEILDFKALQRIRRKAERKQQSTSKSKIKKTITAGIKSDVMLDYEGAEEHRGVYDPMGIKKKQDDTALALRNIIMKETVLKSKKSHQRARVRQLRQKRDEEKKEQLKNSKIQLLDESNISSAECEDEQAIFNYMGEDERELHVMNLWKRVYSKARGGSLIMRFYYDLSRKIYLFGVSKRLEEMEKEEEPNPFAIQLNSKFKSYWNIVNIILLLYTAIYMPFKIAFIDDENQIQQALDWSVDFLFFVDIVITFFSTYEEADGYVQQNLRIIAASYVRGWFLADFIACFPFQVFDLQAQQLQNQDQKTSYQKLLRLMRLPRLYRFLKIMKVLKSIKILHHYRWYQRTMNRLKMNGGIVRMIQGCIATVVITHLFACFWFLTAKVSDFGPETWVARKGLVDEDNFTCYIYSLYWAMQTVITLGYGDIPAVSSWEIFLSLFWMLFGEIFYSFIVATYTAIISGQIEIDASIQLRIKSLAELSKLADIPFELSKKIKKFIENNYEAIYNQDDEATIIKMLPPYLRDEVLSNTFGEVVEKIKFFQQMEDVDFLWKVLPLLIPLKIEKTDVVYWQGEYAQDVFYIMKGIITLHTERGHPFCKYKAGDTLGDSDTMLNLPRDSKAIASTNISIMFLKIDEVFEKTLQNQEKNIMDMILLARKKRDSHSRLMIEADKKAAKEAMIQSLIADKNMLLKFVTNNERQVNILTQHIIQKSLELNLVRAQNKNLKNTLYEGIKHRKRQQLAIESYHSRHDNSSYDVINQSKSQIFNKLFNSLKQHRDQAINHSVSDSQSHGIHHHLPHRRNSVNRHSINSFQHIGILRPGDGSGRNQGHHKETEIKLVNLKNQHLMQEHSMQVKDFGNDLVNINASQLYKSAENTGPMNASTVTQNGQVNSRREHKNIDNSNMGSGTYTPGGLTSEHQKKLIATQDDMHRSQTSNAKDPNASAKNPGNQSLMVIEETGESIANETVNSKKNTKTHSQPPPVPHASSTKVLPGMKVSSQVITRATSSSHKQLKKKTSFQNILAHHQEIVIPEIFIEEKEKLSMLDKVLISAFKREKLFDLYQQFPFLQRVTTDDNNQEFSEKLQRMKAELMMNELAQNPENIANQMKKTEEIIQEHVQMELDAKEKSKAKKGTNNSKQAMFNSEVIVDKSKTSFSGDQSDNSAKDQSRSNIMRKGPTRNSQPIPSKVPESQVTSNDQSPNVKKESSRNLALPYNSSQTKNWDRRMSVAPVQGEQLFGFNKDSFTKGSNNPNDMRQRSLINLQNDSINMRSPKKISVKKLQMIAPPELFSSLNSGGLGQTLQTISIGQISLKQDSLLHQTFGKQPDQSSKTRSRNISPFALTKLAATNQLNPLVTSNYNSLDSFVMNNRLRSNPPPVIYDKQAIQVSITQALNHKIVRRKTLKGKLDQIRSESRLKYQEDTAPFISIQKNEGGGSGHAKEQEERPQNFGGYYERSMSKRSKDIAAKNKNKAEQTSLINEIHQQVSQEVKRKLREQVIIQSAVPAVMRQPLHQAMPQEIGESFEPVKIEIIDEQIDYQGHPQLETLVHFNGDMGHVSLNIFETYTVFDLITKQNQTISENLEQIQHHNQKIEQHQSTIDKKLDELQQHLLKLKELKGKKRLQLGFSLGKTNQE